MQKRRGGHGYERDLLFAAVLEQMGFPACERGVALRCRIRCGRGCES
ncbi:hypothetical protein [Streptomyces sp. cg35]